MDTPADIDPRDARIAELEARNAELEARNAELEARVLELEELVDKLQRHLGLNSSNSSKPPSTDDPKARAQRRKKKKRHKTGKRGGQLGHKGHKRELLPPEQVDHFVEHDPAQCACGLKLGAEHATGTPLRAQQFELVPRLVECTEHRLHACRCPGCGKNTRAQLQAPERLGWGPRLTALLGAMSVMLHATRGKLDWFLQNVLGAPSCKASVQNYLEQTCEALAPAHEQALAQVRAAPYIGCDETGWRKGRLPYWIWLAQSPSAVVVQIRESRKKECAKELLEGCQARVITTDRYGGYNWLEASRNQACRAHLLRDWKGLAQRAGPLGKHGARLVELEGQLHAQWRQWKQGEQTREEFLWEATNLRMQIEHECVRADTCANSPGVVRWVMDEKHRERCWAFMRHEDVELTNNQSERDVRTCVIQRKLSFGSQSEAGLRLMERLWTVGLTCQRQGRSILEFITEAVTAHRFGGLPPVLV